MPAARAGARRSNTRLHRIPLRVQPSLRATHHPWVRDFDDSTLWRISSFNRVRLNTGSSGFARLGQATVLPTTLLADLRRLDADPAANDVLEVLAACMRHREAALLCIQHDGLVWPITVFPVQQVYHSPRALFAGPVVGLAQATLLTAEPPGVRPPGHWMHERIAHASHYRPLLPLLWSLALQGPRTTLLAEIAGTAAYRATRRLADDGLAAPGALSSAAERLRRETVAQKVIAGWPGMSPERANRLLNGLYLLSALLVTRAHPAARAEPKSLRARIGGGKPPR